MQLLSYHNDAAIKTKYVERFALHRAADEVTQGIGFENGRGCFVGCTLDSYDHSRFPVELGWPEWLARLADTIFEGIPKAEAPQFGTDLLAAVPVGVDLEPVKWKLAILRHTRQVEALKGNTEPYAEQCRNAIANVINYCEAQLAGIADETAARSARSAAESAARSARSAESAAWSAAESAESAAESARSAAWSAAESAARSAAWSAAESAAWSAHFQWERDTLLSIIRELKPIQNAC